MENKKLKINKLKFIWDDLKCNVCNNLLVKPRSLSCQHSFCSSCISVLLAGNILFEKRSQKRSVSYFQFQKA